MPQVCHRPRLMPCEVRMQCRNAAEQDCLQSLIPLKSEDPSYLPIFQGASITAKKNKMQAVMAILGEVGKK